MCYVSRTLVGSLLVVILIGSTLEGAEKKKKARVKECPACGQAVSQRALGTTSGCLCLLYAYGQFFVNGQTMFLYYGICCPANCASGGAYYTGYTSNTPLPVDPTKQCSCPGPAGCGTPNCLAAGASLTKTLASAPVVENVGIDDLGVDSGLAAAGAPPCAADYEPGLTSTTGEWGHTTTKVHHKFATIKLDSKELHLKLWQIKVKPKKDPSQPGGHPEKRWGIGREYSGAVQPKLVDVQEVRYIKPSNDATVTKTILVSVARAWYLVVLDTEVPIP
jgi:hypothetical protein